MLAHERVEAIGSDDDVGPDLLPVGERDPAPVDIAHPRAEAQVRRVELVHERRVQVAPMEPHKRRVVALGDQVRGEFGEHRAVGAAQRSAGARRLVHHGPEPRERRARTPLGQIDSPAPSGRSSSARS